MIEKKELITVDRAILHIDANSYYASVECLHHPELHGKAVAVGGDTEARHGIILSVMPPAKRCGVKVGEALWQARQKCPELIILPPHFDQYLRFSRLMRGIYREYSPQVEPFGLDEAWVEITGTPKLKALGALGVAEEIRLRVKAELGITVSIGVSFNKVFAKLGSDYKKPDAVTVFGREDMEEKIWPLPASDLLYVGKATEKKLLRYGIRSIGQLAQTPPEYLQRWLGKWGLILSSFARGLDNSPVAATGETGLMKSIGNSTTMPRDLQNVQDASIVLWMLCESVAERLRENGFLGRTVQISLRSDKLSWTERQKRPPSPVCTAAALHETAMELLSSEGAAVFPLRSIGVRACELVPARTPRQVSLFESEEKRVQQETLERTVDDIRRRFGHFSVSRAIALLDPTLTNLDARSEHVIHPVGFFKAV